VKEKEAQAFPFFHVRAAELTALLEPARAIRSFLKAALRITEADSGSFILLNPDTGLLDIEASIGLRKGVRRVKLKLGEGITGWVATTGEPLRVSDVRGDRRYVCVDPRVQSELAVPVEWLGSVIGVINVDSHQAGHFTAEHQERLTALAEEAARWLAFAWEVQRLRRRGGELTALLRVGRSLVSQSGLDSVLQGVVRYAAGLLRAKASALSFWDGEKEELFLRASFGTSKDFPSKPPIRSGESLMDLAIRRGRAVALYDLKEDPYLFYTERAQGEGFCSMLAVPLVFGKQFLGVLSVYTAVFHRFSTEEIRLLQMLADLSSVAIQKARLWERLMETEEALRRSERLSALGLLAAEVAHEIRNPLTVVQMLFHSLVQSVRLDERAQKDAAIIGEKMRQMNRILDQILHLGRSSDPILEWVDASRMLEDILLLVRPKAQKQGVTVRQKIAGGLPLVLADRAQLEQALLNLVLNALEAMPEGGSLWLEVQRRSYRGVQYLALGVRDTGPGLPLKEKEELFTLFQSSKPGGTGIGLAIVRRIVENHRGKLLVQSRKGRGTRFRILIPIDPLEGDAA
jgi:signal transduction histidine kinase